MTHRGSAAAAQRFMQEAKRWAAPIQSLAVPQYIAQIAHAVSAQPDGAISLEKAEKYLMYGVLLQNYALHCE